MRRIIAPLGCCLALLTACQPVAPFGETVRPVASEAPLTATVTKPGAVLTDGGPAPIETVGGVSAPASAFAPGELIVRMEATADAAAIATVASASVAGSVAFLERYTRLRLPTGAPLGEAAKRLEATPGVRGVGFNWLATPNYLAAGQTPNDPRFAEQWGHRVIHSLDAWHQLGPSFTAAKTIIAFLDTGCDTGHPEFGNRILAGRNFTNENPNTSIATPSDVTDQSGHGTHVVGIAAAAGNDGQGVCGLAWDAQILPVKVLGQHSGDIFSVMQGLRYVADFVPPVGTAVRAANLSLGVEGHFATDAAMEDAMAYAWRKGIVVVVAAGNSSGEITNPATNQHGVVVSATGRYQAGSLFTEIFAGFSNRGDRIDVAAPGGDILSTLPRTTNAMSTNFGLRTRPIGDTTSPFDPPYGYLSGTSMSAPFVSALASLLAARYDPANQNLTATFADQIANRLKTSADDLGPPGKDPLYGYGRINAAQALAPASL